MRWLSVLAITTATLAAGSPARAVEITTIKYDLSHSIENLVGPLPTVIPFSAGTMTLEFRDLVRNSVVDRPAAFHIRTLHMTIDPRPVVAGLLTGSLHFMLTRIPHPYGAAPTGLLTGDLGLPLPTRSTGTLGVVQTGFAHCLLTAYYCLIYVNVPNSVPIAIGPTVLPFPVTVPNLGPQGTRLSSNPIRFAAGLSAFTARRPDGAAGRFAGTGSFQLVGAEIGRTVVPEPRVAPLLLLAALSLTVCFASLRAARRAFTHRYRNWETPVRLPLREASQRPARPRASNANGAGSGRSSS